MPRPSLTSTAADTLIWQLKMALHRTAEREWRFHKSRRWRFDVALPDVKLAIEINGGAFLKDGGRHTRGPGYRADCEKLAHAAILGWRVIPCLPEQVKSGLVLRYVEQALTAANPTA